MKSEELVRSPLWSQYSRAIGEQFRAGVPFSDIFEMNCAIKQRDLEPYRAHQRRLDEILWPDDSGPKTIIDFGAGYGAMGPFWPAGSKVYNIDLPEMLEIQQHYLNDPDNVKFVPFTEADSVPFEGAYLFAAWSLTETTLETWEYYISKASKLAGLYVIGFQEWAGVGQLWPWERLAAELKDVRVFKPIEPNSYELCGVNR